jgi:hypothetical protein
MSTEQKDEKKHSYKVVTLFTSHPLANQLIQSFIASVDLFQLKDGQTYDFDHNVSIQAKVKVTSKSFLTAEDASTCRDMLTGLHVQMCKMFEGKTKDVHCYAVCSLKNDFQKERSCVIHERPSTSTSSSQSKEK